MGAAQRQALFPSGSSDALVAYLIKRYNETSRRSLGRTILQKLCYFAKASDVPLPFRFEIYHYGPFSQEIFDVTDNLQLYRVIDDLSVDPGRSDYVPGRDIERFLNEYDDVLGRYKTRLDDVVATFDELDPSQMELVSTIHYMHTSHREWFKRSPDKSSVVSSVLNVKGDKFDRRTVEMVYDILHDANLLH